MVGSRGARVRTPKRESLYPSVVGCHRTNPTPPLLRARRRERSVSYPVPFVQSHRRRRSGSSCVSGSTCPTPSSGSSGSSATDTGPTSKPSSASSHPDRTPRPTPDPVCRVPPQAAARTDSRRETMGLSPPSPRTRLHGPVARRATRLLSTSVGVGTATGQSRGPVCTR